MEIPERIPVVQCPPFVKLVGGLVVAGLIGYAPMWVYGLVSGAAPLRMTVEALYLVGWVVLFWCAGSLLHGRTWAYRIMLVLTFPTIIGPLLLLSQRAQYRAYVEYRLGQEARDGRVLP